MLRRSHSFSDTLLVSIISFGLLCGCGLEQRTEETATIDGTVTYGGETLPAGSRLVLEDKSKGIRMSFDLDASGHFEVNDTSELPAGTYNVGVLPPANAGVSESEYEDAMSNPDAVAAAPKTDDFPVPADKRDPAKSGKTVDVDAGSQTLTIEL